MPTTWDPASNSPDQRYQPTTGMLLRLLAEGAQRRSRLIAATGRPASAVAQALTTLKHRGLVIRLQYGLWTLTDAGREQLGGYRKSGGSEGPGDLTRG
jgi:hypothetical protein